MAARVSPDLVQGLTTPVIADSLAILHDSNQTVQGSSLLVLLLHFLYLLFAQCQLLCQSHSALCHRIRSMVPTVTIHHLAVNIVACRACIPPCHVIDHKKHIVRPDCGLIRGCPTLSWSLCRNPISSDGRGYPTLSPYSQERSAAASALLAFCSWQLRTSKRILWRQARVRCGLPSGESIAHHYLRFKVKVSRFPG